MAKKRLKIAFLNIYNGVIDRGAETFVKEVASRLGVCHEVDVFQSGEPTRGEKYNVETINVGWDWSRKSGFGTFWGRLFVDYWSREVAKFTLRIVPKIIKRRYDIVVPVNGGWMPAIVRIATWISSSKMVISGQSGIGWDDRNNLWTFPGAFVALSNTAKKWAKKVNPFVRVEQISNGVDLKKFSRPGGKFPTNLRRPIVLCVSALTPTKRVDLVIKAVSRIKNASLLVAGDGDLKEELTAFGKELMPGRFRLVKIRFEDMPGVYRSADIFTIASESFYSFEIVLVEAMASGLPVVANNDLIRREIVGGAGILVDPTDTGAYTKALRKVLKINWGNKPRSQAKKFSWDKIAKQYEELFLSLLK